jgi:alpha-tubulin suppressor-like RCC1 family protein
MGTISLGKVALTWRGEYDVAVTYARQDLVHFNGTAFICLVDGTVGVTPVGGAIWQVFSAGIPATDLAPAGTLYYVDASGDLAALTATAQDVGKVLVYGDNGLPAWQVSSNRPALRVSKLEKGPSRCLHARAIMENGDVRAWGQGTTNQLGQGAATSNRQFPSAVAFPIGAPPIVELFSDSNNNTWAIDTNGDLWGWGTNRNGSLGLGDTAVRQVPVCLTQFDNASNSLFGKTVTKVAVKNTESTTANSTIVLCSDGTVHAAGANVSAQLGDGTTTARNFFNQLAILSDIIDLQATDENLTACVALKSNGEVFSWGRGTENVLGHGATANTTIPTKITALNNINIVKMSVGSVHAGYIDDAGNLYMVGTNTTYGNLGLGDLVNRLTPVLAATDVADVLCRGNGASTRTFIIKTDGTLQAAGSGTANASGINNTAANTSNFTNCLRTSDEGVTTSVMDNIVEVQQKVDAVVAKDANGILWGVGNSTNGVLGSGTALANAAFFREVLLHRHNVADYALHGSAATTALHILTEDGQLYISGSSNTSMNTDAANRFVPAPVVL